MALLGSGRRIAISDAGIVQNPTLYEPLDAQNVAEDSFLAQVGDILALRKELNVAAGKLYRLAGTETPGVVAIFTALPDGSDLLTLVNFSQEAQSVPIQLEKSYARVEELKPGGGSSAFSTTSGVLTMKAEAWSCRVVRLFGGK